MNRSLRAFVYHRAAPGAGGFTMDTYGMVTARDPLHIEGGKRCRGSQRCARYAGPDGRGAAAIPLMAAACKGSNGGSAGTAHAPVTIDTRHTSLGTVITDGRGRSLYLFESDNGTTSTCYGACAATWESAITVGSPRAGAGASASLVATTVRRGGTTQVTYAGHPLYYYSGDSNPADVAGQGLQTFGGGWDLLKPSGDKVESGGH